MIFDLFNVNFLKQKCEGFSKPHHCTDDLGSILFGQVACRDLKLT